MKMNGWMGECICESRDPEQETNGDNETEKLRNECVGSMMIIMHRRGRVHETTSGREVDIRRIQRRPPVVKKVVMWSVTIAVLQIGVMVADNTQTSKKRTSDE